MQVNFLHTILEVTELFLLKLGQGKCIFANQKAVCYSFLELV